MEYFRKLSLGAGGKIIPFSSNLKGLNSFLPFYKQVKDLSNKSCIFTKVRRSMYLRLYPAVIVEFDGSTFTARYYEPRNIIKLPFDISKATLEDRAQILKRRKPIEKVNSVEEETQTLNVNVYLDILKKSSKI